MKERRTPRRYNRATPADGWIRPEEAARRLGCSVRSVQVMAKGGRLRARKGDPGHKPLWIDPRSVEQLLEEHITQGERPEGNHP